MSEIGKLLVKWFNKNKRSLAWRYDEKQTPNTYNVWLSEVMLQQTTVQTVKPFYDKFLKQFPTLNHLASASLDEVIDAWAGLGYYARARNLHACAQKIVADYGGEFPRDLKALRSLPGIGDYTAGAITAIAFNKPAIALDGNAKRVVARIKALRQPINVIEKQLKQGYVDIFYDKNPSACAQAIMELGSQICTKRSPKCSVCPVRDYCGGRDFVDMIPNVPIKGVVPVREGALIYIASSGGEVLLRRRALGSMLGGCLEFVGTGWHERVAEDFSIWRGEVLGLCDDLGIGFGDLVDLGLSVEHVFTHYKVRLHLFSWCGDGGEFLCVRDRVGGVVVGCGELGSLSLPTLMVKARAKFMKKNL